MSAGYYQKNKKKFQKRLAKGIKIFLKKRKTKCINMFVKDIKVFLKKKKTKSEKLLYNAKKMTARSLNKAFYF